MAPGCPRMDDLASTLAIGTPYFLQIRPNGASGASWRWVSLAHAQSGPSARSGQKI